MAHLSLTDALGLDVTGALRPEGRLARMFSHLPTLWSTPVDQVVLERGQANLTFTEPVPLGAAGFSIIGGAGAGGSLRVITRRTRVLDPDDPFDSIDVQDSEVWLALSLDLSLTKGGSAGLDGATFGITDKSEILTTYYRRFRPGINGVFPSLGQALAKTAASFAFPQSGKELENLEMGVVAVLASTGQLKLTAQIGLETTVHQLAASSPAAGSMIDVHQTGGLAAQFGVAFTGGYQIRLRRLAPSIVELGVYKTKARALSVEVSAKAGVTARLGSFDLLAKLLAAISRNPVVDKQDLLQALPGESSADRDAQIAALESSLSSAVSTNVQLSLAAAMETLKSNESIWTFEIDFAASGQGTEKAIDAVLRGDLSAFAAATPGIRQTSSAVSHTDLLKQQLTLNLLGLMNFLSLGKTLRTSTIKRNANGEITLICDKADASHLEAWILNGGWKTARLRALLNEDFLIQASFHVAQLQILPPEFSASHTFFEIHEYSSHKQMQELLGLCRALGLIDSITEKTRLGNAEEFGHASFWLQAKYESQALRTLFLLDDGTARGEEEFELQGRKALAALVSNHSDEPFRQRIADTSSQGNALWSALKADGNVANFNRYFGLSMDLKDPRVVAAGADYSCITDWAKAMKQASDAMVEVLAIFVKAVGTTDSRLLQAREHMKRRLADVVRHSGEHFSDPLGLVMIYYASAKTGTLRVIAQGPKIERLDETSSPPQAN